MRRYNSVSSRTQINFSYFQYVLLFICIYWMSYTCSQVDTFDLSKYYYGANYYVEHSSFVEMIENRITYNIDFLYYVILYLMVKASIPLNLVTTIIVFLYYILIVNTFRKTTVKRLSGVVIIAVLFITPMTWIVSMSRNLTAFLFLYIAIFFYYKNKVIIPLLFAVAAVFTHFSVLMYVAVLLVCIFLKKVPIRPVWLLAILISALLLSVIIPSMIQNAIFDVISGQDISYNNYAARKVGNIFVYSGVNYSDKVPVLFALIYSISLLFINRKQGFEYWTLLLLSVMLLFFMNSSWTLTNRCLMFLPIFWGLNVKNVVDNSNAKDTKHLELLSMTALLSLILHLYGNRHIYFLMS